MQKNRKNGQGMVEYIIIVAVIALAAITIFGLFGDKIREKMGGAVQQLGGTKDEVDKANTTKSDQYLRDLK